ncbi:MAG: hypothetical protein IJK52_05380 [Oscillospiraceae bacterium]|nr:hypothetical protein [Oscillospiraceae bacterium]
MESMLIRERYKVARVLWAQRDYALVEAADIQERATPVRLLNLYEGELLHRYGRICAGIRAEDCPAFRGMFLENDTLAVVFDDCKGVGIDSVFFRGDGWNWRERLDYAELLLHHALSLSALPPEIACAAMLSENLLFDAEKKAVVSRYAIPPMQPMNGRELALLSGDQILKILPRRLSSGKREGAFLDSLERGQYPSIVPLYSAWRKARKEIEEEREAFDESNFLSRGASMLKRGLLRIRFKPKGGKGVGV